MKLRNFHRALRVFNNFKFGGANENRTHDLLHAMQALYQLSYDPKFFIVYFFLLQARLDV